MQNKTNIIKKIFGYKKKLFSKRDKIIEFFSNII